VQQTSNLKNFLEISPRISKGLNPKPETPIPNTNFNLSNLKSSVPNLKSQSGAHQCNFVTDQAEQYLYYRLNGAQMPMPSGYYPYAT